MLPRCQGQYGQECPLDETLGVLGGLSESSFRKSGGKPKAGDIDSSQNIWPLTGERSRGATEGVERAYVAQDPFANEKIIEASKSFCLCGI